MNIKKQFKRSKGWAHHPEGTKVYDLGGGHWEKVKDGWKWYNGGSTFPTPGLDWHYIVEPQLNRDVS